MRQIAFPGKNFFTRDEKCAIHLKSAKDRNCNQLSIIALSLSFLYIFIRSMSSLVISHHSTLDCGIIICIFERKFESLRSITRTLVISLFTSRTFSRTRKSFELPFYFHRLYRRVKSVVVGSTNA